MTRPLLYVALSSHGYGHATRAASIVAAARHALPALDVVFAGAAPPWLLEAYVGEGFRVRRAELDVGVAQPDSLTIDTGATLRRLEKLVDRRGQLVAAEVAFVRRNGVGLILGDIPPLAAPIADAAGIPCWMVGNFGWDFIYREWDGAFASHVAWIRECYARCDRLFRVPFHEPMAAFRHVTDVGLTGGVPRFDSEELRDMLDLDVDRDRTVLLTFGGLGYHDVPYEAAARWPSWRFLTFDKGAPELPNLRRLDSRLLRPVDVMPLCARVVGKPGYSTYAEAIRLGVAIAVVPREGFAEARILVEGVRNHADHQVLCLDEFLTGDWTFLGGPPSAPRTSEPVAHDGSEEIGDLVARYFSGM